MIYVGPVVVGNVGDDSVGLLKQQLCGVARTEPSTSDGPTAFPRLLESAGIVFVKFRGLGKSWKMSSFPGSPEKVLEFFVTKRVGTRGRLATYPSNTTVQRHVAGRRVRNKSARSSSSGHTIDAGRMQPDLRYRRL